MRRGLSLAAAPEINDPATHVALETIEPDLIAASGTVMSIEEGTDRGRLIVPKQTALSGEDTVALGVHGSDGVGSPWPRRQADA